MQFIYHIVPRDMMGTSLLPLNTMKTLPGPEWAELYRREMAKYDDDPYRRLLPQTTIPKLDCMWNDVVQACPLHPYYMYEAWQQIGRDPRPDLKFYAIPIRAAGDAPIAIYTYTPEEKDVPHIDADEIEIIRPEQYKELHALPAETRAWYRSLHARGLFGAFFHLIPHVFIKGPVDLSDAQIIDWNEPPADALVNW